MEYRFKTPFLNEITVEIRDRSYTILDEEVEEPPIDVVRSLEEYRSANIVDLLHRLNNDISLSPAQKWALLKRFCGGNLLIPLFDPYINNINVNEFGCVLTHTKIGNLMFSEYTLTDLESLVRALMESAGHYVSETEPFLERSIELGRYVLRLSLTTRDVSSITYQNTVSIRKHPKKYYTLVDQVVDGFIDSLTATLLACNVHFSESHSVVVFGIMGTRKTSLLVSTLPFVPPCSRVGILQDSAEVEIRYLPYTFIEYFTTRPARGNLRPITLVDLEAVSLRRAYDKLIIAEVRRPEEIRMFAEALHIIYGVFTTLHAADVYELVRRFASSGASSFDFEKVRIVIHTAFRRLADGSVRPRVVHVYRLSIRESFEEYECDLIGRYHEGSMIVKEEKYRELLYEIGDSVGMARRDVDQVWNAFKRLFGTYVEHAYTVKNIVLPDLEYLRRIVIEIVDMGYDVEKVLKEVKLVHV